jgi:MFS family permease
LAKRVGLFIACGALAGAFSGLISYGVARINNPAITHWRILFLIEGLPSLVLAIVVFFFLPSRPETTRYLNEDERTLECTRLNAEALGDHNAGLDWAAVRRGFMSKRTWIAAVMYSAMNLGLSSVSR